MNKEEIIKPKRKVQKFREILVYFWAGVLIGIDMFLGYFLWNYRGEYFDFTVDFSRSIELGFFVLKIIILVGALAINLKSLKSVLREWKKETYIKKEEKREGEEEIKRMGLIKKLLFYWRVNGARKWMDKYHEEFERMQKTIGKIRGKETKELIKLKEEMIKGVLIWTDDFQITKVEYGKKGEIKQTEEPVTEEFLDTLYLDEIYEDYSLKCLDTAERFVNGHSSIERGEII